MQKSDEKKILGTVPKKLQLVETFWDCPEFSRNKQNQRGITLIALIITIIVMLILVGVTITVALNGGLFSKVEEATTKTKIAQVKEALAIKKAEIVADNNGIEEEYTLTISDLSLPAELKTEYGSKLIISKDGKLYYDASVVTNEAEQNEFKEMGIEEYVETNVGTSANSYTFTIAEIMKKGRDDTDITRIIPVADFWPEDVSDELKNTAFSVEFDGGLFATNLVCSDQRFTNLFAEGAPSGSPGDDWTFYIVLVNDEIFIYVSVDDSIKGSYLYEDNYIGSGFENLAITIGLPE